MFRYECSFSFVTDWTESIGLKVNVDGVYSIFFSNIRKDKKLKKDREYIIRVLSDATV